MFAHVDGHRLLVSIDTYLTSYLMPCWLLSWFQCKFVSISWWRHQMETFSALLVLCAKYSPVTGEFYSQRPVTWSFDIFFDLRPNKRLSKQSWGWWFETPSRSLLGHCNDYAWLTHDFWAILQLFNGTKWLVCVTWKWITVDSLI